MLKYEDYWRSVTVCTLLKTSLKGYEHIVIPLKDKYIFIPNNEDVQSKETPKSRQQCEHNSTHFPLEPI